MGKSSSSSEDALQAIYKQLLDMFPTIASSKSEELITSDGVQRKIENQDVGSFLKAIQYIDRESTMKGQGCRFIKVK